MAQGPGLEGHPVGQAERSERRSGGPGGELQAAIGKNGA